MSPSAPLKNLFCAAANNCVDPNEYFKQDENSGTEIECFNANDDKINTDREKRQSWALCFKNVKNEKNSSIFSRNYLEIIGFLTNSIFTIKNTNFL